MIRVLIFGKDGRVGQRLVRTFSADSAFTVITSNRDDTDLAVSSAIMDKIIQAQPHVIINAAACNGPEQCADNPTRAYAVNAQAVAAMAECAKKMGALLVHYSTDYVFSDSQEVIDESTRPNPQNLYGASKLAGEAAIRAIDPYHLIFRLASVYGDDLNGPLDAIKQVINGRGTVDNPVQVLHQLCAPISARLAASLTHVAVTGMLHDSGLRIWSGVYHMTAGSAMWKADFARAALHHYKLDPDVRVVEGKLREPRPAYLPMASSKLQKVFSIEPWGLISDLAATLDELTHVPKALKANPQ